MIALLKKEYMESLRTGKLYICAFVFAFMGVLSPALSKLTPVILEHFDVSIPGYTGEFGPFEPVAMDSFTQFYKNIPMALIAFVLLYSGFMAVEYQKGTFISVVTKGVYRGNILRSKLLALTAVWTVMYFICFFITYGYTVYYWEVDNVKGIFAGVFMYYLYGLYIISLMLLFSTISKTTGAALMGVGVVAFIYIILAIIPDISRLFPGKLTEGLKLIDKSESIKDFRIAILVTVVFCICNIVMAHMCFRKKKL